MLEVKNLAVTILDKKILDDFSLKMNEGEIHAIMGPNGTGKSTLSKVIMGSPEYELLSGDILLNGESIKDLPTDIRAQLGLFLSMQNPVSIEGISNSELIKTAVNSRRKDPVGLYEFIQTVENAALELHLDKELIHRSLNVGASGGERKKNEIFQLKLIEPSVLILDELDSGLDIDSLKIICDNINDYLEKHPKTSVLIITHYPRILQYIKPKFVHIMLDGRIVKTGGYPLALQIEKEGYAQLAKTETSKDE